MFDGWSVRWFGCEWSGLVHQQQAAPVQQQDPDAIVSVGGGLIKQGNQVVGFVDHSRPSSICAVVQADASVKVPAKYRNQNKAEPGEIKQNEINK